MYSQSYVTLKAVFYAIGMLTLACMIYKQKLEIQALKDATKIPVGYRLAWVGAYKKESSNGQCFFLTNTGDEGYYYETESKAKMAAYSGACSDTAVGYKVYFESIDAQPALEPIK